MNSPQAQPQSVSAPRRPLVVVSNREPYLHSYTRNGSITWSPTTGGVAVALDALMRERGGVWIAHGAGAADRAVVGPDDRILVPPDSPAYALRRIWLTEEEEERYYAGFSNEGLWPLCHVAHVRPVFRAADWRAYRSVNERIAAAIAEELPDPSAPVFIQDYHLALVAAALRARRPDVKTALFWHIPWPHPDRLRICPWRREIMAALLANDLLAFQLERDRRNFLLALGDELDVRIRRGTVHHRDRATRVVAVPIGVDYDRIQKIARDAWLEVEMGRLRSEMQIDTPLVGIGVDRLDYTKGIPDRLEALDLLFARRPDLRGRLTFVQIGVPSRSTIRTYAEVEATIDRKVADLNRRYAVGAGQGPIRYRKSSYKIRRLVALYRLATFCIVSSLDDGMNLVAKEFVAARDDLDGVLVLSELAGAAQELREAVIINPYDIEGFAQALEEAIEMPAAERQRRMRALRRVVAGRNVFSWAADILESLEAGRGRFGPKGRLALVGGGLVATYLLYAGRRRARGRRPRGESEGTASDQGRAQVVCRPTAVEAALEAVVGGAQGRRLLLLSDFDGTLCELASDSAAVALSPARRALLATLAGRPDVTVGIVSGRRLDDVRARAGVEGPVFYAGLHGLEIEGNDARFVHDQVAQARGVLQVVGRALAADVANLDGVRVENKDLSVALHVRDAAPAAREIATRALARIVEAHLGASLRVQQGDCVQELMPDLTWNKGDAVRWIRTEVERQRRQPVWPVYLGDDLTDEDAFAAIGSDGVTVVVGNRPSQAACRLRDPSEVEAFLRRLIER